MSHYQEYLIEITKMLQVQQDRLAAMIKDDILPPFGATLYTLLNHSDEAMRSIAENLHAKWQQTAKVAIRAEEEAQAWGTVHDELVVDIAEALDVLSTEISKVEIEEDPLVRMQGLIRCRDKKEVLGVVVAQTEAEAAAHLDGGEREAAMQMKPVVCQLASVSIRADALIQDELRVLRGALESMEALLHENLAKLNDFMSQPAPDLSLDGLARLIKEQMSELRIDAAEVLLTLSTDPTKLKAEYGKRADAMYRKLAFDTLKETVHQQSKMVMNRRLGQLNSFTLRQTAACEILYKRTFTLEPISNDHPPAEIEVEVSACLTGIQQQMLDIQARYEAELKKLQVQLAVMQAPLEHKYEAEVAHRKRLEVELQSEKVARQDAEVELARLNSGRALLCGVCGEREAQE